MTLSRGRLNPWFLLGLLLVLGFVAFRLVGVFLSWVLFGLFLAYLTFPIYERLLRWTKRASVAASVMLVVMTAGVLVPLAFLLVALVAQAQDAVAALGLTDPQEILDAIAARLNDLLGLRGHSATSSDLVNDAYASIQDALQDWVRDLPRHVAEGLIGVFVLAYVLYYAYTDGPRVLQALREMLPMQADQREVLFRDVGRSIRGVMYGTVLMSALQAVLAAIGFFVFGVPDVVLWSVVVFVLALLPIVGAPMVWLPWSVYLVYTGETFRGVGLLLYSAIMVNGIEHVIRPKLIGSVADIHPLLVLLGVIGGLAVFGFIGVILGPMVLSVFVTVLNLYRTEFARKSDAGPIVQP